MAVMNLRHLEHFAAVADTLNFRRAAERLNLSQQAVSKSILQLENQIALRLLERGRQSVILTEHGRELLPYALEVIAASRRFDEAARSASGQSTGSLAVGATPTFLESVVPAALNRFHERFPETPVIVERGDFSSLTAMMLRGNLDLVLSTAPDDLPRHLLSTTVIGQDRNVIVVRSGHPLTESARVKCGDLRKFPLIVTLNFPRGSAYLARLFGHEGITAPRPALTVGSTLLGINRVLQTDAWWIVPRLQVKCRIADGDFVELPVEPHDSAWDLLSASRRQSRPSRWRREFEALICDQLKEAGACS